ncbi:bifunctional proline dehydrogenase/L-glutamate gamma-semialdehyde dehydrogenase PutA [Methylonatrum kenyense]|uniref:bifunctional proline dehydrogenase/L-glutamate gamma-semialdehyde dehydrogenase PutA n=1 Tax=Methylonatrum kenyense TaxID=455253 RepID=UPI0020BF6D5E|nr:bifunctional proline dehydrogenase/L-glutamate gamma-semialdehyde dehydrogenase PutA [Methylonatrum kenyense]MCK8515027.1 bifunctional proline dehydrogenase/L-glutamate gamma-semialdehyde dehydrogenase PutA [Methylonatrum kenyense]
MLFNKPAAPSPLRKALREAYRCDEAELVQRLADLADVGEPRRSRIGEAATALVHAVRSERVSYGGVDALLHEYDLSSKEGVVLMCLAEALMRVPDADTADRLIQDKISSGDWGSHLGRSESLFVNASTWGLMLTGRVVKVGEPGARTLSRVMKRLVQRSGEPVIRQAIRQAMRIMGRQFVIGRTIDEALKRAREDVEQGYTHSFDMLGEAARTQADADRYYASYQNAIHAIGTASKGKDELASPGISVKLSALHPRYEFAQQAECHPVLVQRLTALAVEARQAGIGLCVDAEEANRLDISLDIIEAVSASDELQGWNGFGLAIQAYQKRCIDLVDWLADMARRHKRVLMVRLVKGAYWDTEVKDSQEGGYRDYPVFTRKVNTDVSYLACARRLLEAQDCIYPQFATHNAHSVAWVREIAGDARYEFQRLHGMGEALYDTVTRPGGGSVPCRIYAPVGSHEELLPYLVRRLLENGANTSFVNRIQDEKLPIEEMIADPVLQIRQLSGIRHPRIPLPADLYGPDRKNSAGIDLSDTLELESLRRAMEKALESGWHAAPLIEGKTMRGAPRTVSDPADRRREVGSAIWATPEQVKLALTVARKAAPRWDATPAEERAACLDRMANLMEANMAELMALCVREAGKGIPDAVAEVREAVDFCRYYANRARADFAGPMALPGPTGERNEIRLQGRGVFVCISPWNFPLAIFCGEVTAALAAGNAVLAKPAEQTTLIGFRAVQLLHEAGIPTDVLQLLPGDGAVGAALVESESIDGVAFTGSVETARRINQTLARRDGPIIPLIAETGGQNAMIADSTALPEQLVVDVIASAFQSAGQRCSAQRVLYLQEEVADHTLEMLAGAMDDLVVDDPAWLATDVGPVIDADAQAMLQRHIDGMRKRAKRVIAEARLGPNTGHGTFVAPIAFEIGGINELEQEVFGPVLHVVRYKAKDIDGVIEAINATGFGLTLGIHTRIDSLAEYIAHRVHVGNCYVNRNQIGAVVGVQPFGGEGLSGTGPKAGGPRYLHRFASERVLTIDTTAAGGNASLFAMTEDEES